MEFKPLERKCLFEIAIAFSASTFRLFHLVRVAKHEPRILLHDCQREKVLRLLERRRSFTLLSCYVSRVAIKILNCEVSWCRLKDWKKGKLNHFTFLATWTYHLEGKFVTKRLKFWIRFRKLNCCVRLTQLLKGFSKLIQFLKESLKTVNLFFSIWVSSWKLCV